MTLLQVTEVTREFTSPSVTALRQVSFAVTAGQRIAIVGPSGCGKSTLLRIIAGLDAATAGTVSWHTDNPHPVALMPQHDALFEFLTVIDNVALPEWVTGSSPATRREHAMELLTEFGLADFSYARPRQLSGGMRSRVAFLRTMSARSDLLALDEPFGALDALTRLDMQQWLLRAAITHQLTLLLVTHDVDEAVTIADRVLVLSARPGEVIADVPVKIADRSNPNLREDPAYLNAYTQVRAALNLRKDSSWN
ncbi:MAG: ABC transporter ATP-binding protein [Trueperella sp.]|nr:ABC transporter ATP-binding protein [Trueperella sp.]